MAGSVVPVFQVAAVLVVALTGANLAIQAVPMTVPNGISLMLRVGVVAIFLNSFGNFFVVYDAITEAPSSYCRVWCLRVLGHAAIWLGLVVSIPSLNVTPLMTLAR